MLTSTTAIAALADAQAQHELISSQLEAISQELTAATPGTAFHLALSQRAVNLSGQIAELDQAITTLTEAAKTEEQRQTEAAALEEAAAKALAARVSQDRAKAEALIAAINDASDQLAAALAEAGKVIPTIVELQAKHGGLKLSGPWPCIVPSTWAGEGKIGPLPWVHLEDNAAMLSTRGKHHRHVG